MSGPSLSQTIKRKTAVVFKNSDNHQLNLLIKDEKTVIKSILSHTKEKDLATKALTNWGEEEYDDISDITSKLQALFTSFSESLVTYSEKYESYRAKLKLIRNAQEHLDSLYAKKKSINESIKTAEKKNKPTLDLNLELDGVEKEIREGEAGNYTYKRKMLRDGFREQFFGLNEFAVKAQLVSEFGLRLIDQIPANTIYPNESKPKYTSLNADKTIREFLEEFSKVSVKGLVIPSNEGEDHMYIPRTRTVSQFSSSSDLSGNNRSNNSPRMSTNNLRDSPPRITPQHQYFLPNQQQHATTTKTPPQQYFLPQNQITIQNHQEDKVVSDELFQSLANEQNNKKY